jgi:DNA repair exonuclease SbcCD ATPase subunit
MIEYNKSMRAMFGEQQQKLLSHYQEEIDKLTQRIKIVLADKDLYNQLLAQEQEMALKLQKGKKNLEEFHSISKKEFKLDLELTQIRAEAKGILNELEILTKRLASKNRICPLCDQEINPEKFKQIQAEAKKEHTAKKLELQSISDKEKDAATRLKLLTASLLKFKKLKDDQENLSNSLSRHMMEAEEHCEYSPGLVTKIKVEREKLQKKLADEKLKKPDLSLYKEKLKKIKEEALIIKPQYQEKRAQLKLLKWLIDEPLSNKGLKAYIFNSMLSTINDRLRTYSKFTGFTLQLNIDLDSGRKNFECILHRKAQEINYTDLSGGEQQLADVALSFAIHDVVSMDDRFNLLIMDEVFESCDDDNVDTILDMLQEKGQGLSLHLITHLKKVALIKTSNVTQLKKTNGRTRII